jgi:hypothetical protein
MMAIFIYPTPPQIDFVFFAPFVVENFLRSLRILSFRAREKSFFASFRL